MSSSSLRSEAFRDRIRSTAAESLSSNMVSRSTATIGVPKSVDRRDVLRVVCSTSEASSQAASTQRQSELRKAQHTQQPEQLSQQARQEPQSQQPWQQQQQQQQQQPPWQRQQQEQDQAKQGKKAGQGKTQQSQAQWQAAISKSGVQSAAAPMGTERHLATAMLFLVALSVCLWLDVKTATDLLVSGTRAFVQLTAVGLGLKYIFTIDSSHPVFVAVAVMVVIASYTASQRAKSVPRGFWVALVAVATGTVTALSLLVSLQVVRLRPRFVIPIGGIVVGSSMTIAANTMQRLADDFEQRRGQLEAALALGASQWEASLPLIKRAWPWASARR
ncbi:hypothetical protein CLOM_g7547 [Closterium sp. NIES-68]|nr:hypothetical protein CLOM_g7547 [Closterium sp. NIES-68]